jgi:hypothetical protein
MPDQQRLFSHPFLELLDQEAHGKAKDTAQLFRRHVSEFAKKHGIPGHVLMQVSLDVYGQTPSTLVSHYKCKLSHEFYKQVRDMKCN